MSKSYVPTTKSYRLTFGSNALSISAADQLKSILTPSPKQRQLLVELLREVSPHLVQPNPQEDQLDLLKASSNTAMLSGLHALAQILPTSKEFQNLS